MVIIRDDKGRFSKGNAYWLGRTDKKPNSGSFKKGMLPWNKDKKSYKVCEKCGKSFSINKGNMTKPNQRFCSRKCYAEYRHLNNNQPLCQICHKKIKWGNIYCKDCYKKENHHWWKGGITPVNLLVRSSVRYKKWREKCFKRDNWTCQKCGDKKNLQVHHIKEFSKYTDERFLINNGITLCKKCHKSIHKNKEVVK